MKTKKQDRTHPPLLTQAVRNYLDKSLRQRDSILVDLEKDAEKNEVPISGPHIGNALFLLAKISRARNVLEIGTATGYSGIWLSRALEENHGKLTTIEMDQERQRTAEKALKKAGIKSEALNMILGDARKIVPEIARSKEGKFDMIFNDVGDKSLYSELLDDCVKALRKGGLLILDDTLFRGVALPSMKTRKARAMRDFNRSLISDERLDYAILPVGDGLSIAVKR